MTMRLGISPCPNDTFIFHALLSALVPLEEALNVHMADVEELNSLALRGELEVSKISVGVVPYIMDTYVLLSSGGALGWGCGPLVVAREDMPEERWKDMPLFIPGRMTTANLLLDIHGGFSSDRQELLFSEIMPALERHERACGVIIHEGRFTYAEHGLVCLLDLGRWWEDTFHTPLPLGVIAVRRDIAREKARQIQDAIRASLAYARSHPEASDAFVREHAQEMDTKVIASHIETFVTDYSLDLGEQGRAAIELMVARTAAQKGKVLPQEGLFLD